MSPQLVHCCVADHSNSTSFLISFVYGFNHDSDCASLWGMLINLAEHIDEPWCVLGDFNSVLYVGDQIGGTPVQASEFYALADIIRDCGLSEPPFTGPYFSWTNKTVWSRIDRVFVNTLWYANANFTLTNYLPQSLFDHTPLLIQIKASPRPPPNFQFCDMWIKDPQFLSIVRKHVPQYIYRPFQQLWLYQKAVRRDFCKLNRSKYCDL